MDPLAEDRSTRGHAFSRIGRVVGVASLKETGVRFEHRNPGSRSSAKTDPPPGPGAYVVEGTGEGVSDDEYLNPQLRSDNPLPIDKDHETFGRTVAFQPMARDRSWIMSSETLRISVLVIGHTHRPRIVYGPRMRQQVLNAQVGVIDESDLRIYQLTF